MCRLLGPTEEESVAREPYQEYRPPIGFRNEFAQSH